MEEIKKTIREHISQEDDDLEKIKTVLFGDTQTGQKGLIQKVDEMYEIVVQAKGLKGIISLFVLFGGAIGAIIAIKQFILRL